VGKRSGCTPTTIPAEEFDAEKFEELARDPKVVAIGECGLDYFRSGAATKKRGAKRAV
jgi:Tat protein secretion system quality control protein TatD with DNase activity